MFDPDMTTNKIMFRIDHCYGGKMKKLVMSRKKDFYRKQIFFFFYKVTYSFYICEDILFSRPVFLELSAWYS